ncbi:MAG: DNA-binding protein [Burkholderiaceae bacterium]
MSKTTKTAEQVQREFREAGISLAEWARAHGFERMTVVDVLRGHRLGNYGEAHRVAVALGLKDGTVVNVKKFKPAKAAA